MTGFFVLGCFARARVCGLHALVRVRGVSDKEAAGNQPIPGKSFSRG